VLVQFTVIALLAVGGKPWRSYLHLRPTAVWALESPLSLYQPIPEVFMERVAGRELAEPKTQPDTVYILGTPEQPRVVLVATARLGELGRALSAGCRWQAAERQVEGWTYAHIDRRTACHWIDDNTVLHAVFSNT
jgi:hypothetical protein